MSVPGLRRAELAVQHAKTLHARTLAAGARGLGAGLAWELLSDIERDRRIRGAAEALNELAIAGWLVDPEELAAVRAEAARLQSVVDEHLRVCQGMEP